MSDLLYPALAGVAVFATTSAVSYAPQAWAWLKAHAPSLPQPSPATPPQTLCDRKCVEAAIRRVQIRALELPPTDRTDALAECDRFAATVAALFDALPKARGAWVVDTKLEATP